jgi:transposase
MPNILKREKQIAVIAALAEGMAIRQIERMTEIHGDTIMRLGVRVGQGRARRSFKFVSYGTAKLRSLTFAGIRGRDSVTHGRTRLARMTRESVTWPC